MTRVGLEAINMPRPVEEFKRRHQWAGHMGLLYSANMQMSSPDMPPACAASLVRTSFLRELRGCEA